MKNEQNATSPRNAGRAAHQPRRRLYRPNDSDRQYNRLEEQKPIYRSAYRRDYARLLHSPAFRRLQGKTQLFPGIESDFFRNRLTHSLEVAQIAKSIALRFNSTDPYFRCCPIDLDLIETSALAHDLGHPPFGHNGEEALDECMRCAGGFEGNAQTLRILARLEKKEPGVEVGPMADDGVGLNLTFRTLASVLKYECCIPRTRSLDDGLVKGHYGSEAGLVECIKAAVLGNAKPDGAFKTIECAIMDLADDIAYSTYDLEDAFKAGFVTPLQLVAAANEPMIVDSLKRKTKLDSDAILEHVMYLFQHIADLPSLGIDDSDIGEPSELVLAAVAMDRASKNLTGHGAYRTTFTSELVSQYVESVEVSVNDQSPALSTVLLPSDLAARMAVLKHLTYEMVIESSSLKTVKFRGKEIVTSIFRALDARDGAHLLPDDFRQRAEQAADASDESARSRVICDFIAGMTDRYAVEFYGRLNSDTPQTVFKPL